MNFYTNVYKMGNNILYRGVKNNRRVNLKLRYSPVLFLESLTKTDFKTLNGQYVKPVKHDSMGDAIAFCKKYENIDNFKIYGNQSYVYAFIGDNFKSSMEWDKSFLRIMSIDIECSSDNGFPKADEAKFPITAITLIVNNNISYTFGCGDYICKENEIYIKCEDEIDLIENFIDFWSKDYPDILVGWNSKYFDIPYIVNRINKLFGEEFVTKLSPWNTVNLKKVFQRITQKHVDYYEIVGVTHLDYMDLYKTFAKNGKSQENYRLDNIANVELGEGKLSYDEYDNLHDLYLKNHQKFIEYNIKDTRLIDKLDEKLNLIDLALTLAYDSKCNIEDVFQQTRMWDSLIYNYLKGMGIVVPQKVIKDKTEAFEGAYVKPPIIGLHRYIASFDLDSLYPHLIQQYNISPETLIEPKDYSKEMRHIINQTVTLERLLDKAIDLSSLSGATLTPNGQFFSTTKKGFLPKMLEEMYSDRKKFKKMMLECEQQYEDILVDLEKFPEDPSLLAKKEKLIKDISKYNNIQLAKKVCLNSAYGSLGTEYFRYFDIRMALAVTQAGKLSIMWIENTLNKYLNNLMGTKMDYVIASDTDSIYLELDHIVSTFLPNEVDENKKIMFMDGICDKKIKVVIDKGFSELCEYVNGYAQRMRMKREALADKGIWTAKKRYILNVYNNEGVQYKEPHIKCMGIELVKSSTPTVVRDSMKKLIKIVINNSENECQKFISDFKLVFNKFSAEEIAFPRSVNNLTTYFDSATLYKFKTPFHVKGSLLYNSLLDRLNLTGKYPYINEGDKIKYIYLRLPNPYKMNVIAFPGRLPQEFGLESYIDYDTQFEKTFLDPIRVILDCMKWKSEKTCSLEDFFV